VTLTTTQLRTAWAPACKLQHPTTISLHGTGRVTVDDRVVDAVHALDAVLKRHNYRTRKNDTGAYNCRKITGGTGHSLHSYGIALDINWNTNGYGRKLVTDMAPAMVAEILAIRTGNGKQVWRWGGHYKTNRDAMHYEVVCTPADLATGIRGAAAPTPPQGSGIPHDVLREGAAGPKVTAIQWTLTFLGHPTAVDGDWGPKTTAAVRSFQQAVRRMGGDLVADGVWGPRTAQYAEYWTVVAMMGRAA